MSQSLSKIYLHIVFSTKNREALIPLEIEKDLHAYMAGVCRSLEAQAYRVGGTEDHVHVASTLPCTISVSKFLQEIKVSSSAWIKDNHPNCHHFA